MTGNMEYRRGAKGYRFIAANILIVQLQVCDPDIDVHESRRLPCLS